MYPILKTQDTEMTQRLKIVGFGIQNMRASFFMELSNLLKRKLYFLF